MKRIFAIIALIMLCVSAPAYADKKADDEFAAKVRAAITDTLVPAVRQNEMRLETNRLVMEAEKIYPAPKKSVATK